MILILKHFFIKHRQLRVDFLWRLLQLIGKEGFLFATLFITATILSPFDFGTYSYLLAIVLLLVLMSDFGMSTASSRFVAEYSVRDNEGLLKVASSMGLVLVIITGIISVIFLLVGKSYLGEYYQYVSYILPLLFLIPLTSFLDGVYRGLQRFKILSLVTLISGVLALPIAYWLIDSYALKGAFLSQTIFYLINFLTLSYFYKHWSFTFSTRVMKEIGFYGLSVGLASIGFYLSSKVNVLIFGHYDYIEEIGIYEIINKTLMIVLLPLQIIGQVVAPRISILNATNNFHEILGKYKSYLMYATLASFFLVVGLYFIFPIAFSVIFSEYSFTLFSSIFIPTILVYGVFFLSAPINQGILVPVGYVKPMIYLNFVMAFINLTLGSYLVSKWGVESLLWLTFIMMVVAATITQVCFYRFFSKKVKYD